jgi:lysophospholipase L1-like esterase
MVRRRSKTRPVLAAALALVAALYGLVAQLPARAGAASSTSGFYLDVGGSSSLGYEPTGLLTKDGQLLDKPSNNGYANDVVKLEASNIALRLTKLGCPGETVATLLGEKDHCYKLPVTQMLLALKFLNAHQDDTGIVSIDIGYNDVQPCIETADVEVQCVDAAKQLVTTDLPKVIAKLRGAAGPNVHFVGLEYPDPFLARYLMGASERSYATQTLNVITELDQDLTDIYNHAGVAIVDVPAAFSSSDATPTRMSDGDVVPKNVAEICTYTYMCRAYPFGPDDHPNNMGYQLIAKAIVRALPSTW